MLISCNFLYIETHCNLYQCSQYIYDTINDVLANSTFIKICILTLLELLMTSSSYEYY